MRKILYLFYIPPVPQENQKVFCTQQEAIWSTLHLLINILLITIQEMFIGVRLMPDGLRGIPTLYMALWQTALKHYYLRAYQTILIFQDFGKYVTSIK